jgi:hypothetical protein
MWYKFHQNRLSRSRDILFKSLKKSSFEKNTKEKKTTVVVYLNLKKNMF